MKTCGTKSGYQSRKDRKKINIEAEKCCLRFHYIYSLLIEETKIKTHLPAIKKLLWLIINTIILLISYETFYTKSNVIKHQ